MVPDLHLMYTLGGSKLSEQILFASGDTVKLNDIGKMTRESNNSKLKLKESVETLPSV